MLKTAIIIMKVIFEGNYVLYWNILHVLFSMHSQCISEADVTKIRWQQIENEVKLKEVMN